MAKLKQDEITATELAEYVQTQSDFAFELHVYNQLVRRDFKCEHGGTYEDPITGKLRQFDIRALWRRGAQRIRLAVECKQLQPYFPLLVTRVPRVFDESKHDVLLSINRPAIGGFVMLPDPQSRLCSQAILVHGRRSIYGKGELVGKACAQVGRDNAGLTATDSEVFAKWTQAISSAQGLAELASRDADGVQQQSSQGTFSFAVTLVIPAVVVPDKRLWVVDFNADGTQTGEPSQVERCPYLINAGCECGVGIAPFDYNLSHLEIVTVTGLLQLVRDLTEELHQAQYFGHEDVHRILGIEGGNRPGYGW